MLKLQEAKLQHFPGHVEDVEVAEEFLGGRGGFPLQLQHLQHLQHFPGNVEVLGFLTSTSSTGPLFEALFHQKMLKTGEMLKIAFCNFNIFNISPVWGTDVQKTL